MEERKRHKLLWSIARPLCIAGTKIIFNYDAEVYRGEGPYLVMANHNAELDPMLLACSFPEPLYFVASEHILRKGFVSDLLRWSTRIIPRQKGGNASSTIRGIVRNLGEGNCVCIFPEGNRSWDGVTAPITPATGKMARMTGAKLITYRTEGIYFANPRWAGGSLRRGKTSGHVVGVYEPEYLKSLTAGAVQELIETDLHEDAYARQKEVHTKFRGRKLAENLETMLFICPSCKAEGHMHSQGNDFYCSACGARHRYTPEGYFAGSDVIFDTVLDWNIWQNERIKEKCLSAGEEPIFSDTDMLLYKVKTGDSAQFVSAGEFILYRDRLVLPDGNTVSLKELKGMSVMGPQKLHFSTASTNYVVKSTKIRCVLKYLSACKVFDKNLQYGI